MNKGEDRVGGAGLTKERHGAGVGVEGGDGGVVGAGATAAWSGQGRWRSTGQRAATASTGRVGAR